MERCSWLLEDLTWKMAESSLAEKSTVVILPVGATEQHGVHLPLKVDAYIVRRLADKVASRAFCRQQVLVTPTLCFGCSEHHLSFAGTISLRHETFMDVLEDIISSLYRGGARRFLILNGHGGNYAALSCVVQKLQARLPILLSLCSWWNMARDSLSKLRTSEPGGAGHAGEIETSLMMYLAPHLVEEAKFRKHIPKLPDLFFPRDMLRSNEKSGAVAFLRAECLSPDGQMGDPTAASPEKGAQFWEAIVSRLISFVIKLGKCPISCRDD